MKSTEAGCNKTLGIRCGLSSINSVLEKVQYQAEGENEREKTELLKLCRLDQWGADLSYPVVSYTEEPGLGEW